MARLLHKKQTRHGYHGSDVYKVWCNMIKRCETKVSSNYKYYGGRGISVCKTWRLNPKIFCEWALNNGFKKGLEIDRIDENGNYNPGNCQFLTHKDNCAPFKRSVRSTNKTGYTGISISKLNSFEVYVTLNGKQKYVGVKKSISEALILRDRYIKENIHDK